MAEIIDNLDGTITMPVALFDEWSARFAKALVVERAVVYAAHVMQAVPPEFPLPDAVRESLGEFQHTVRLYLQELNAYVAEVAAQAGA